MSSPKVLPNTAIPALSTSADHDAQGMDWMSNAMS